MKWAVIKRIDDAGKERVSIFAGIDGEIFVQVDSPKVKEEEVAKLVSRDIRGVLRYSKELLTYHGAEFTE